MQYVYSTAASPRRLRDRKLAARRRVRNELLTAGIPRDVPQTVPDRWLDIEAINAALDLEQYWRDAGYGHAASLV